MATRRTPRRKKTLDARPDTVDFRDLMYVPTLVEVPVAKTVDDYQAKADDSPILDQGKEGTCTGFGLAAVANYLLRTRSDRLDTTQVSPWMLYIMARRYDEYAGEDYSGSSARGAMKGWFNHGACSVELWSDEVNA